MTKNNDTLLMIFIKNPVKGKVKTRLAKTIGDEKALDVYHKLLKHTQKITSPISGDKLLFYSDFIDSADNWNAELFQKQVQTGRDLGERMSNAFQLAFLKKHKKVIIIGSDCIDLTAKHIDEAFNLLEEKDIVIGPAKDGGYYLVGMKALHQTLFLNKKWSSSSVFSDTIESVRSLNLSLGLLEELSDIDDEKDLKGKNYLLRN